MINAVAASPKQPTMTPSSLDPISEAAYPQVAEPELVIPAEALPELTPDRDPAHTHPPAQDPAALPSIRSKAIRSSLWTVFGFGSSLIIRFGSNLILSRLL